ncbi:hypothetical protein [Candidatus Entotheonella palauensis]|nr:hypothetical protein [Candidatus Entotheonella palauensis]
MFSELVIPREVRFPLVFGVGLTMIVVGAWRVFYSLLPNERRFTALREEVDVFLETVRQLNAMAYAARQEAHVWYPQAIQDLKASMHDGVERMADVAGVPEAMELAEATHQPTGTLADVSEVTAVAAT